MKELIGLFESGGCLHVKWRLCWPVGWHCFVEPLLATFFCRVYFFVCLLASFFVSVFDFFFSTFLWLHFLFVTVCYFSCHHPQIIMGKQGNKNAGGCQREAFEDISGSMPTGVFSRLLHHPEVSSTVWRQVMPVMAAYLFIYFCLSSYLSLF